MRLLDRLEVLCCQGGDQETGPHGLLPHFLVGSPGDGPARLAARNARVFSSASLAAGSLYSTEWPNARRPGCRVGNIEGMVGVLIDMQRNRRAVGPRMGNHLATAFRRGPVVLLAGEDQGPSGQCHQRKKAGRVIGD